MSDEEANISKVRYLTGRHVRICGGLSVKVDAHYPGRPHGMPRVLPSSRGGGMWCEESAEAIVARMTTGEGPNLVLRIGTFVVRVIADTDGGVEIRSALAEGTGRNPGDGRMSVSRYPLAEGTPVPQPEQLMERVVERSNMQTALKRVKQNKGAPGADGMTVEQLGPFYGYTGQRSESSFAMAGMNRCRSGGRRSPKPMGGRVRWGFHRHWTG